VRPAARGDAPIDGTVSATIPDWSREALSGEYSPGKRLLKSIRDYGRLSARGGLLWMVARPFVVARHRFWSAVAGADIPVNSRIAGGLLLPHPNGVVVHPEAEIGPNCLIFQQVTIGAGGKPGLPIIEGHVDVGAGAKILGGVRIGADARIGANAVVVCDIPPGSTAVGVPAVVKARSPR
jgi:serine O-acetyltransferase